MFKSAKNIFIWIATALIIFALCSPITSSLLGLLFISQNVNSLLTVLLGIICGAILTYYIPLIVVDFRNISKLLKK